MEPQARIKALAEHGNVCEVEANIPLKRYYRSGMEMVKMAAIYEEEGNWESAYILYMRYMILFLEKISHHPDFPNYSQIDKINSNKKVKEILPRAEKIKVRLKEKFQKEYDEFVAEQKSMEKKLKQEREEKLNREKEKARASVQPKEGIDPSKEKWNNLHLVPFDGAVVNDPALSDLTYPMNYLSTDLNSEAGASPAGEIVPSSEPEVSRACPVPSKELKPKPHHSPPSINRGTKPLSLLSAHHGQRGSKLRTVAVPQRLMEIFLQLAHENTSKNIETCGILAGKLASNKFLITHLLVPRQVGTADSCTTQHEEELFDHQDKLDLITLGWIHTHPTQTAFLSSVDLHTHCSYQLMMPEALAIVCAPKFDATGFFTLTQSHGLSFIANCHHSGFHPHPVEPPLFQEADHVRLEPDLSVHVVDLRR